MNILDENFSDEHRRQLRRAHIHARRIGGDLLAKGYQDYEIIDLLRIGRRVTFFSLDRDYYRADWRHSRVCLVFLDLRRVEEAPHYIRLLLRHPLFDTEAKRLGHVIRVTPFGLTFWQPHGEQEQHAGWE